MNQKHCKQLRKLARNSSAEITTTFTNEQGVTRNSAKSARGVYRVLKTVAKG